MDFAKLSRPQFGGPPDQIITKADRRRTASLRQAAQVIKHLPAPGEALHALMTGRYDLLHLVLAILQDRPAKCEQCRIATLSFHQRNVHELMKTLDAGTIGSLTLLCSTFFRENTPAVYDEAFAELVEARKQRLAFARNHAKVVCLAFADGVRYSLEGSANLRTNSNQEQFCLIHDAKLHDWHAQWIDAMVKKNEGDRGREAKASG